MPPALFSIDSSMGMLIKNGSGEVLVSFVWKLHPALINEGTLKIITSDVDKSQEPGKIPGCQLNFPSWKTSYGLKNL